jgi:hypothetical protein
VKPPSAIMFQTRLEAFSSARCRSKTETASRGASPDAPAEPPRMGISVMARSGQAGTRTGSAAAPGMEVEVAASLKASSASAP